MLLKTIDGYELATSKVVYTKNGEQIEQVVGEEGQQWWLNFAEKWDHTNIIEFTDVVYTDEQLARLEEVKNLDISDSVASEYVMEGIIGEGLEMLTLQKKNAELESLLADLTEVVLLGGM
jgi:hypothetical protein